MRNGMVVAGSFFQKRDSHKVTYRSGNHKTELDLLVVRRQQLCRLKWKRKSTKSWMKMVARE